MSASAVPGLTHSIRLRVYYEDTDASGIVYHASYLKFAERGRTEMMRALGFAHSGIAAETGIVFTVRQVSIDFRLPARLDDLLSATVAIENLRSASFSVRQQLLREPAQAALVEAQVRIACLDAASFRPRPIPNHLLQEITPA